MFLKLVSKVQDCNILSLFDIELQVLIKIYSRIALQN